MGTLTGKVALVTGASKGIGAATARALGEAGAKVVVNYCSSREDGDRVVASIRARGGEAVAVGADVSKMQDVKRLIVEAMSAFGALDIVVNNAAVFSFDPVESVTEAEFQRQFSTNVWGVLATTQEALKHVRDGGSIVNVGSLAASACPPNSSVYAASKAAVHALTRVLAKELGPRQIRVNAVSPGSTETEGTQHFSARGSEFQRQIAAQTPLRRFGRTDDIAPVVVFLSSDDAKWITGEVLTVAGGFG
jgi:3-oxoacyl-[acyl-carrier protein] reductase